MTIEGRIGRGAIIGLKSGVGYEPVHCGNNSTLTGYVAGMNLRIDDWTSAGAENGGMLTLRQAREVLVMDAEGRVIRKNEPIVEELKIPRGGKLTVTGDGYEIELSHKA